MKLRKVIYDKDEQRKILDDLIDIGIEAVRRGTLVGNEENLVNDIMYSLDYLLPTFKNKGFEEEKEIVQHKEIVDGKEKSESRAGV